MRKNSSASRSPIRPTAVAVLVVLLGLAGSAGPAASLPLLAEMLGEVANDQFGIAVAGVGDLDDDGYEDAIVGASAADAGGDASGAVYLFLGSVEPDGTPDLVIPGEQGDFLGASVSAAGDVNDDGFADFVAGAYRSDFQGEDAGRALVFYGGDPPDSIPDVVLDGTVAGGFFGRSVSGGEDLNGDGFADVVVGAERVGGGQALVFFGGDPMDAVPDLVLEAEGASDRFGATVASIGDVNGDQQADLFVAAPRNSDSGVWAGKGYVYFGGPAFDSVPDLVLLGESAGDFFGSSAAGRGDLNHDGAADLAVGAPYHNVGGIVDAGRAYVFLGGPGLDASPDYVLDGGMTEEMFARSIALLPTVDDDAFDELAVGAPGDDSAGEDAGRVALYLGGDQLALVPDEEYFGAGAGDEFGYSVSGGGDFNGNQLGTLLIGAWEHAGTGAAFLYGDDAPGVGVADAGAPASARLLRVHPNPAADGFVIEIESDRFGDVDVYDAAGRHVRRLRAAHGGRSATLRWDRRDHRGRTVAAGVYFLRLENPGSAQVTRVTVLN